MLDKFMSLHPENKNFSKSIVVLTYLLCVCTMRTYNKMYTYDIPNCKNKINNQHKRTYVNLR